jgi:ATP-dependent helicase/nuclease subunit A
VSLSDKQIAAAHRVGQDVCVVAGPGSGKTSVLIERFSWLVKQQGIAPNRILAITFTEKAATEIKQRLISAFADNHGIRERLERAYVSTIHAFCTRILRDHAIAAGLDPMFEVADEAMSNPLKREAADEVLEEIYQREPQRMRRFLESLAVGTEREGHIQDLAQSLIDIYETIRVAGAGMDLVALEPPNAEFVLHRLRCILREILADPVTPNTRGQIAEHARLAEWAREVIDLPRTPSHHHFRVLNRSKFSKTYLVKNSKARASRDDIEQLVKQLRAAFLIDFYAGERELIVEALREIDVRYRAKKTAQSLLDFADLEQRAIELLESDSGIRQEIREGFDYILMDELQDTNPLQWKLLNLIRHPANFFAVGDINQSIFRFRHAEPELFHGYQQAITAAGQVVDELRDNYRSRPAVLDGINLVFDGAGPGIEKHKLTSAREFPDKDSPSLELIAAFDEVTEKAATLEAEWVAKRITELTGTLTVIGNGDRERPATYADIAILTRTSAAMRPVQKALDRFGIPSIVIGGRTFFEAREVRDLILLLRVIANPCDEVSLAGVLRSPLVSVSDECLLYLRQSGPIHASFAALAFNGASVEDREALAVFHRQLAEMRSLRDSVSPDRLLRIVIDDCDYEAALTDRGKANVEKLLSLIRSQFQGSIGDLLNHIENSSPDAEAPPSEFGNAVRLMSIHKSKGLEFPIVFLPGLHKGTGSGLPVITYSARFGLGVKWRDPDSWVGVGDASYTGIEAVEKDRQSKENDRLLYVAMTRAKEHMVLSFAKAKQSRSDWWRFVSRRFGVNTDFADNQVAVRNGVRVLKTDTAPEMAAPAEIEVDQSQAMLLEKAVPCDQYDSSAPVTSVSLFATCPRKYYLSRYLRWEARDRANPQPFEEFPGPDGELDAGELGVQVHGLLAGLDVQDPDPQAVILAERFHQSALGKAAAEADSVQREFDFLMEIEGIVLRGQIDLWFEHQGRITIVDYKTDQIRLPIDQSRLASYALQLRIYAMAIEKLTGRLPDSAWLYLLRPDQAVEIDLSPSECAKACEAVAALRDAQDSQRFPLSEGTHCLRCEFYKALCPAGKASPEGSATSLRLSSSFAARP